MDIITDIDNIQTDIKSGSFPFLIVESNDIKYQVKLPNYMTSSMINEYIAHKIANSLSCVVPKGVFIKFETSDIEDSIEHILIDEKHKALFIDYDINSLKNINGEIILYGIEWISNKLHAEDSLEFIEYVNLTNTDDFYSIYSYDLYLHNHDRHLKNLLFYQNDLGNYVTILIDHDRIFGTNEGIGRITELESNFECLKNSSNAYLYKFITTEKQKLSIMQYSHDIANLEDSIIEDIFVDYLKNCNHSILQFNDVKEHIKKFLLIRKNNIVDACKINEGNCYG